MLTLYGIKSCDTCRKARKALEAAGKEVQFVDVRETPLTAIDLARFYQVFEKELINTRSTTWRGMSDAEKAGLPINMMLENPTLMKRPVIDADGDLHLGWAKATQDALL